MQVIVRSSTGVSYSIQWGVLYCHEYSEENRVARYLASPYTGDMTKAEVYPLSDEDFYRALKIHGLKTTAGTYGDWAGMTNRLPLPGRFVTA